MNNAGRIGFLIKGEYEETAVYDFLDVVFYGGASYVAKKLTTGNAPERNNEYWQVLAEGGSLTTDGDASDTTVVFEEAENRANVNSGDKLSVIAGKIRKWFSDLSAGAASTLLGDNLPGEKVLVSDAAGKVAASDLASDTLGYLSGLTGDVQEQFDSRPNAFKSSLTIPVTSGWLKIAKLPGEAMTRTDVPDSETLTVSFSCTPTTDAGDYEQACTFTITETWAASKVRVLNASHVSEAVVTQVRKVYDETEETYYLELEVNVPSCPCKLDLSFESGAVPWGPMESMQFDTWGQTVRKPSLT